jgi:ABC-type lipoprotein release transport system permease subunit
MILRLALRNLLRNRWRTLLTAGGITLSVAVMVWMLGLMDGLISEMARGATVVDSGQVLVQTEDYVDEAASYKAFEYDPEVVDEIVSVDGVVGASPRVRMYGLLGNEKRSQVAQIIGVDAQRESNATPVDEGILKGRWLSKSPEPPPAAREVVLGEGLFKRLDIELGAELVVFLEASDGSLGNELLKVVGVVKTGDARIDRTGAYVHLDDAQYIGALDGRAHEIAVTTETPNNASDVRRRVVPVIEGLEAESEVVARTWQEVKPSMAKMIETADLSYLFLYVIVYLVAALGILNTQRMSALERRREFGVMMAIGVTPGLLFWIVVVETIVLAALGGTAGALIGAGVTYWMEVVGLDMSLFGSGADFSMMGVSFSDRLYAQLSLGTVLEPLLVLIGTSIIVGLFPAIQAVRTDITTAISGRN